MTRGGATEGSPQTADFPSPGFVLGSRSFSPGRPSTYNVNILLKDYVGLTHGSYPPAKLNNFRNLQIILLWGS